MLITFTGRKSGQTYTTPVDYSQEGDQVRVFTHNTWWKNLRGVPGGALVTLRLRGRDLRGLATPIADDKRAVADGLAAHLRQAHGEARYYGVTFDEYGNPKPDEVDKAAQTVVFIRIQLC
jgi:hypothetical protein